MDQHRHPIVVGVDGSDHATAALEWATDLAAAEHRPLVLVHGLGDADATWADAYVVTPTSDLSLGLAAGNTLLAEALAVVRDREPDLEVRTELEYADPRELLLTRSHDAAMVVVGSRGRGRVASLLLGSVGAAVARHASCPVAVLRDGHRGPSGGGVLVACDASEDSRPVLDIAFQQADMRGLALTVLHTYNDLPRMAAAPPALIGVTPAVVPPTTTLEDEQRALAETVAGYAEKYPDVEVVSSCVRGVPEERVVRAAEGRDLVVVGARHGSLLHRLTSRSTAVAIVEAVHVPVVVVPVG